ncbi:tripartite tricarboxylate transporter permease [Spiribacter halobius]|uniref:Tripartite tricarboxylate transporter TctA n=1 Tax=Sediminicurvatus halobius TaxID=2182432 RepID=A0A2U2N258_9GAMM|nr:tripartite tricarboxylate transporter permease [Spiribacter halobius]PWG63153.1 tripartite tricarboxylate transporter TctA [Spiribacter halobius]UEX77601.1 tripartite tricarboxylate transporter permease [Spiribacter halobius]
METLSLLLAGFAVALTPTNIALGLFGAFAGTLVGALPGLGPANGIAILIPLVFSLGLGADSAMILLLCVYYGAMYGGRISSIMLNIPGDEPAIMTTLDGYPMARQGRAEAALAISAVASFVGATISIIALMFFAPWLASFAIRFGSAEYFALYILAFSAITSVTGARPLKTLIATIVGLMFATIGLDPGTGVPRYTFGLLELYEGVDFIVALVGLFAVSELLAFIDAHIRGAQEPVRVGSITRAVREVAGTWATMLRSSVVGFVGGILPGAGASLGAFLAYSLERRLNDKGGTFGKGDKRGVAAPEAGNNAGVSGGLVPLLALGVPASGTMAILLAMLVSLGITPGPLLFENEPDLVWGLIAALYVANVVLLVMNLPLIGLFVRMLSTPTWALMPSVTLVAFVGIYSISHSPFDILTMTFFGVLGYLFRRLEISLVPIVLGLVLGGPMETNLRRTLNLSDGEWSALFSSPIAITLWVMAGVVIVLPMLLRRRR